MAVPSFDPYEVLRVPRDASHDRIKRAYRRLAKTTHPDVGGSVGAFDMVKRAYELLGDSERRAHFDATGEIREPAAERNPDEPALGIIARLMHGLIVELDDVFAMDAVAAMIAAAQAQARDVSPKIAEHDAALRRANKLKGHFKRRSAGANHLDGVIDWHIRQIETGVAKGKQALAELQRAIEILDEYDFVRDPPQCDLNVYMRSQSNGAQPAAAGHFRFTAF